jgi:DNA-binding GntR family transcriptional regulator
VTSTSAAAETARLIECGEGAPVLRIDRLYYGTDGAPLELAVSHFNPDRYAYRLELSRRIAD